MNFRWPCYFCAIGTSIGKRYARTDELGVPFAITVDSTSSVTIRERDSKQQIRVNVDEVASVIKEVIDGQSTWGDVLWRYPTHSSWLLNWECLISLLVYSALMNWLTLIHRKTVNTCAMKSTCAIWFLASFSLFVVYSCSSLVCLLIYLFPRYIFAWKQKISRSSDHMC